MSLILDYFGYMLQLKESILKPTLFYVSSTRPFFPITSKHPYLFWIGLSPLLHNALYVSNIQLTIYSAEFGLQWMKTWNEQEIFLRVSRPIHKMVVSSNLTLRLYFFKPNKCFFLAKNNDLAVVYFSNFWFLQTDLFSVNGQCFLSLISIYFQAHASCQIKLHRSLTKLK